MRLVQQVRFAITVLALVALVAQPGTAFAQRDAGSKIRGEYSFHGRSAGRSMQSARGTSGDFQRYVQTAPAQKVEPEVAHEATDSIGQYITKAQRHMAWMRRQAANDPESLASLDTIDKHLAEAAKSHREMHDLCLKAGIDAAGSMRCCQQIDKALETAIAEHDKLMKRWEASNPAGK